MLGTKLGYDVKTEGRKIEVKVTETNIPSKAGLYMALIPRAVYVKLYNSQPFGFNRS